MGFTVEQVNRMTLWEFACQQRGWARAHGIKDKIAPPSDEEFERAVANSRM